MHLKYITVHESAPAKRFVEFTGLERLRIRENASETHAKALEMRLVELEILLSTWPEWSWPLACFLWLNLAAALGVLRSMLCLPGCQACCFFVEIDDALLVLVQNTVGHSKDV